MCRLDEVKLKRDTSLEWALFIFVAVCSLHNAWLVNSHDPYEFLRHGSDNLGYYQWLPATFINQDHDRMYWCHQMENGKWISLFTCGVAVLQLPFFAIGHLFANCFDYPLNGFSSPYGVMFMSGAAVYAGAGCVLAFKLARRFTSTLPALAATVLLYAGTNLFYYSVYEPGMSHVYSFFLVGLFAWCSLRVLDGPRPVHVLVWVFSAGLLVLVRQLNVIVFVFPLIVAWRSAGGIGGFLRGLSAHRTMLLLGTVLMLVPWGLQCAYWVHIADSPMIFTYGKKGEHFEFDKMVPGMVMTSVRNGWFVYTPLMVPVMIVLLTYCWRRSAVALATTLVLTLVWLFYSAWWCWWLGTSYSYRGFVDLYALLVIPLAWLMRSVMLRSWPTRLAAVLFVVCCIKLNFGMMERFNWEWSWQDWTWQRFFEQVSAVVTG